MDSLSKREINLQLQKQIDEEFSFDDLVDFSSNDEAASSIAKNTVSEGAATQTGLQTRSLQSAMENYASAMNRSAIAQSTGRPVLTPTQAYKGFAAEEYFKHTLKINALAKGVPDWKIGIYIQDKANDEKVDKFSSSQVVEAYLKWASNCIENKDAHSILQDELHNPEEKSLEKALALSANIVGMTCNKVSSYDFRDSTEMFDVAIVDEVCKATLPEILSPLIVSRKAILLGDPMQLPPVFCSDELEIIRDIQSCQLDKYMYIDNLFNESVNVTVLNTQYRMSNQIGSMISDLFYKPAGVNLINGRNVDIAESIRWINYVPTQMWPTQQDQALARPRIYNDDECRIVCDIARRFVEKDSEVTVAIIAPYHAQVEALRKMCSSFPNRVKIDTVDGFQGDEKDIVIFSVTRTTGPYRFFTDIRRLNVALSRAKNNLYIVGYTEYCLRNNILHDIYQRSTVESIQI